MITRKHLNNMLAILGIALLASCQKDMDQLSQDMDLSTIRSVNFTLSPKASLGRKIFFDKRLSATGTQSCSSCHLPEQGFAGKANVNSTSAPGFLAGIGEGAIKGQFGGRKPPSASYATFAPPFFYDVFQVEFIGGLFWDGRATGDVTGSIAGDQAIGPFLNSKEHAMPSQRSVLQVIADDPSYQALWKAAWGNNLTLNDATDQSNYYRVGLSIGEYEASPEVNQFSSKFDAWLRVGAPLNGGGIMNAREMAGLNSFKAAKCDACHSLATPIGAPGPLFTDFGYDNIGLPSNLDFSNLGGNAPLAPDAGLFTQLMKDPNAMSKYGLQVLAGTEGFFKTPSLRNVAKGEGNKRYMHNGVFSTLKEVVHFYNTRDVAGWPFPEFPDTKSAGLGDLKLSDVAEDNIVEFLRALSDGYSKPRVPAQRVL